MLGRNIPSTLTERQFHIMQDVMKLPPPMKTPRIEAEAKQKSNDEYIVVEANSQGLVVSGSWEPQEMNVFKSRL